ncbi:hypothetical protein FQR65_LT00441 [Abscondita terminalis]|nr:hypothetical protein FQR65_LT00441 [Abscondita terminalis]
MYNMKQNCSYSNSRSAVTLFFLYLQISTLCTAKLTINVASKNKIQVENIQGYSLKNVTLQLSEEFNKISNEELGVTEIQSLYNKLKYTKVVRDVDKVIVKIVNKLENKLNETVALLNKTRNKIEYYSKFAVSVQSTVTSCGDDSYAELDIIMTNSNKTYTELPTSIYNVLYKQWNSVNKLKSAMKHMYLLSKWDVLSNSHNSMYNCNSCDLSLLWKLYILQSRSSMPRNVMLLLDHGGSLSKRQFQIVKAVAKQMISVLDDKDKVGVLGISDEWSYPYLTEQCLMPNQIPPASNSHIISPATEHNKYLLNRFIDALSKGNSVTNHSLGFQQALQIVKSSNISSNETVMLLYISRGLLSSLTEAKTVLETILDIVSGLDNRVLINTCAVIDESKPVMYETHFLRDVAEQNYTKYNMHPVIDVEKGIMLTVNASQTIGFVVAQFYNVLGTTENIDYEPKISLPIWDNIAKDLTVAITVPCDLDGQVSLLGVDLFFSNIAEDITYYSVYPQYTYAFLINMNGTAVMHPSYPRPISIKAQPKLVDISHLEKTGNFSEVRDRLLNEEYGIHTLKDENQTLKYFWKQAMSWYVVVIVVNETEKEPDRPFKVSWFPATISNKLVHHRLDILPTKNLCKHLNQLATLDAGSLYLSASCFQSPFSYLHTQNDAATPLLIQTYMAYLKDNTRLLANPGFKEEVRDDVVALAHIMDFLRMQHLTGSRAKYIVRRYLTSPTGVVEMFPGGYIPPGIEQTKRTWYLRAMDHKYKTILTPPYLDAGGAGYIVTIAYATQYVTTAMDVTFGYVYKLILQQMPFCNKNVKCFMMDDRGYLIYHPNLIDPNGHGPIEQQHIIHKESLVANDILNHKYFVKKMLCNDYADGTIQRFYRLNVSLNDVLTNAVHGEHCVKYQIAAVEGTNVFIGIVNATCEVIATFCPCSMVDRLCLNCYRMEQKECECPCECPLNLDTCTHPKKTFTDNPLCSTSPEQSFFLNPVVQSKVHDSDLKSCLSVTCEAQLSYDSCLGVLGCEWCQFDVDGESSLVNPFCTSFSTCFNGVLGSVTPYGDAINGPSASEDVLGGTYSPIGPIVGSIIGVGIILGLMFFCYRSYNSSTSNRFYFSSTQDNEVRMSDFNMSDDFQEVDNHQEKLLQDTKKRESISPYCVSTGYRRPLTTADSDHGYSTMTPHDESEHLSLAPVEIDSLEDDCMSDATSVNTSVSSKQPKGNMGDGRKKIKVVSNSPDLQMTSIPNRIIAPVTVHRNMEMTQ